jgi:hypothetical protein
MEKNSTQIVWSGVVFSAHSGKEFPVQIRQVNADPDDGLVEIQVDEKWVAADDTLAMNAYMQAFFDARKQLLLQEDNL